MVEIVVPIAFFTMVATIVVGTPIARAFARRMDRESPKLTGNSDLVARLERIEQSVDAVATEVERIAEGQRFTTKLLSDGRPNQQATNALRSPEPNANKSHDTPKLAPTIAHPDPK